MDQKQADATGGEGDARFRVLDPAEAYWRPSNQLGVQNTDLGKQLGTGSLGARLWRLAPGQTSTKHRHYEEEELYFLLEGTGRMRVDGEVLTLAPHSAVAVAAPAVRQLFNDTAEDALWLVVGAPRELANTLEMTPEQIAFMYPDARRRCRQSCPEPLGHPSRFPLRSPAETALSGNVFRPTDQVQVDEARPASPDRP